MNKIVWNDIYSVDDPKMDYQHKKIAYMINELIDHELSGYDGEFVAELLTKLTDYCLHHLAEEEELLKSRDYPDFAEHIIAHNAFRKKVVQFCSATSVGVDVLPAMLAYLVEWWKRHIGIEDKRYKQHFRQMCDNKSDISF